MVVKGVRCSQFVRAYFMSSISMEVPSMSITSDIDRRRYSLALDRLRCILDIPCDADVAEIFTAAWEYIVGAGVLTRADMDATITALRADNEELRADTE